MKLATQLCIICSFVLAYAVDEYFLHSDGELLAPKTISKPIFNDSFLLPAVYSGFTNQRLSFYVAAYYCILYNMTLVLPEWVFDYNYIHKSQRRPFNYFYTINAAKLAVLEDANDFKYVETLPSHLWPSCFAQLQTMSTELNYMPTQELLQKYVANHGVICLHADGTFYGLANAIQNVTRTPEFLDYLLQPLMQSLRSVVEVSDLYQRITRTLLDRMTEKYGHTDFLSVHVRNEYDFAEACAFWSRKAWGHDHRKILRACYQDDSVIYAQLTSPMINIPLNNSILMIMNYDHEDITFLSMSALCHHRCDGPEVEENCHVFHCIRKETLMNHTELLSLFPDLVDKPGSLAMIDDQLAQHGILFFGNLYSTMSVEIYHERKLGRTPYTESVFYNRICSFYSNDIKDCP